jgi:hypothetical protein
VHKHAGAILACDFFVTTTARFRTLYVFVLPDVGTRRIVPTRPREGATGNRHLNDILRRAFQSARPREARRDHPNRFIRKGRSMRFRE